MLGSDPPRRTHYDVLGVPHDAELDVVKRAYRRLALELHPDKRAADVPEADANARFQELVEAFKVRARTRPSPSSRQILDLRPLARPTRSQRAPVPRRHPRVTRDRIGSRLTVPDPRETLQVVGDAAEREAYDAANIPALFTADVTAPRGGVHSRDSWDEVIARATRVAKKSKRGRDDSTRANARGAEGADFPGGADLGTIGEDLPIPAPPKTLGSLPREIVVEVFGCVGVGRLLEVEARERTPIVAGSNLTRPGAWFPALKFRLGEREISRLAVVKNLRPRTTYGFRARAGVRTEDLGEAFRGSAARAVPEVFGPWSDESVPATTTATNEDDVASAKEARRELRAAEKAMRRERKDAKRKERKSKRSTRSDRTSRSRSRSASPSAKRKKRKKKRRRRESSSDDSETDS